MGHPAYTANKSINTGFLNVTHLFHPYPSTVLRSVAFQCLSKRIQELSFRCATHTQTLTPLRQNTMTLPAQDPREWRGKLALYNSPHPQQFVLSQLEIYHHPPLANARITLHVTSRTRTTQNAFVSNRHRVLQVLTSTGQPLQKHRPKQ